MVFNIPMNALFATDATSDDDANQVEVNVRVIGEGELDVKFSVNGTNSVVNEIYRENEENTENESEKVTTEEIKAEDTAEVVSTENEMLNEEESTQHEDMQNQIEESEDNETVKEYTLVINKVEEELIITASATSDVSDKYSDIYHETYIATIKYDGQETYDMPLVKYADLSDFKLEFSNGIYSRDDIVFNGSNEYEIRFPYEVECKLVNTDEAADNEPTISKVEGTNNWLLSYHRPGTYTVNITSVSDSEQFAETEFNLKINNKLEFRYEDNKDKASESITITPSSEDNSLVGEVKKVISSENETFALELWGLYKNDITYLLNDGAASTINAQTGEVSIGACETITVTATCNLTGETAQYKLVIEAAESDMTVFEDDNEDGQIGEDERIISDTTKPVELDAMEMIGKTIKVAAHMEE